jgi:ferrous iron transport protein B
VPGTYSLSARSSEEQIAIQAVLGFADNAKPDLAIVVLDAGQLVRNLYLLLQLVELEVPCVACLNMIDEVEDNPPDPRALAVLFGVPTVATNGRTGQGIAELTLLVRRALLAPPRGSVEVKYPPALRPDVDRVAEALPASWRANVERDRALARWALTSIDEDDELVDLDDRLRETTLAVRRETAARDLDQEIIAARYAFLDQHAPALFRRGSVEQTPHRSSERLDRVLLHPVYGFAAFLVMMTALFQSLFTLADPAIHVVERIVAAAQVFALTSLPPGFFRDLVVQGVLGGVGNVIVFIPGTWRASRT